MTGVRQAEARMMLRDASDTTTHHERPFQYDAFCRIARDLNDSENAGKEAIMNTVGESPVCGVLLKHIFLAEDAYNLYG
jgi:hypothetical protein